MEARTLEGGGAFRERWACGPGEEYSGGQMPGWRERGQGRARRHLLGWGTVPYRWQWDSRRDVLKPLAARTTHHLSILGMDVGRGRRVSRVWKHLEIRPCDCKWVLTSKEVCAPGRAEGLWKARFQLPNYQMFHFDVNSLPFPTVN